jgi:hypothetical protein
MIAELDSVYAAGSYAMVSVPASGLAVCNDTSKPQWVHNCTEAYEDLRSNITLVKEHPALWGYYICDDCCKGYTYLGDLASVYATMKQLDPYHLTAGEERRRQVSSECSRVF